MINVLCAFPSNDVKCINVIIFFFATLSDVENGIPILITLHQSPTDCAAISCRRYI